MQNNPLFVVAFYTFLTLEVQRLGAALKDHQSNRHL
jgi:hypothetical protein